MGYKKTSLQVTTGSGTSVHVVKDDGSIVLASAGENRVIEVSSSVHFGADNATNSLTGKGAIVSGMFRIPLYDSASAGDISILNTLASSPSSYNGYMFYLSSSSGLVSGGMANGSTTKINNDAGQYFARAPAMYFCRNGKWFSDNLVHFEVPPTDLFSGLRRIFASFEAAVTDYDIPATSVPTWAGGNLEFSSSLSEHGDWNVLKVGEPTWTYNTHKRIGPVNWAAGDTDYDISATSVPSWSGSDLEFSSSLSEYGGWNVLKPGEPTWTYNTHKRIGPVNWAAGDTDYDISATSVPSWAGGDLEFSSSLSEHGDWTVLKPGEPTWTYNTHKRIGPVNWAAGDTDYDIAATSVPSWTGGDLEFSSSIGESAAGWNT